MIKFFDTTLRDGEQSPGCSMNNREKLQLAKQLEKLQVDVIEAGFAASSQGDFESVRSIANEIKSSGVAVLARAVKNDIDRGWEAVKNAAFPRIHTFIATSDIHMKYKLKMDPEDVIKRASEMVSYASSLAPEVEFSAEDATRSDPEFLARIFDAVIQSGAKIINIPDTVGYTTPDEFYDFINEVKSKSSHLDKAIISVHCHNDLGLGVANTLAALKAGATQFECTINGIGERAGNAALEELVMILDTRRDRFDCDFNINTKEIMKTSNLLTMITGVKVQPNKAIVGANAFAHESGIHQHGMLSHQETYEIMKPETIGLSKNKMVLGKHSGRHAFKERLESLGYVLTQEELDEAFEQFKNLADKKKQVFDRDIQAIVTKRAIEETDGIKLVRYVINSGNTITSTATVTLKKGNSVKEKVATGDGPVDASFNAIKKLLNLDVKLEEYSLQAVTEGTDALGETVVKVSCNGQRFVGRGLSTDIVESSINAYLEAVGKALEEQKDDDNE
ncbi:2-isopropylmalate synthase [Alkalibacter sp. M17DMB]|nr:2-isopropylmalate synthase [Alkalibacter mobilis]MBF7096692.1 2-isopropylmalate synthase [Alkalibacter mobilis]